MDIFPFGDPLRSRTIMALSCCLLKLCAGEILGGPGEAHAAIDALGPVLGDFGAHCLGTAHSL